MARFLAGERFVTIQWLERKQTEKDLIRPNILRRYLMPLSFATIIIWRTIGLSSIMDWMESFAAAGYEITGRVIPLKQGELLLKESTAFYIMRSLYSNIISILGRFSMLA